ncbi:MAG TPA: pyruvate kinase [Bacillota bacterium]
MRRTKIVATLGPASEDLETLTAMIQAGVDVVRINLSHGALDDHRRLVAASRAAAARAGKRFVATLFDTRGPEIRVGELGPEGLDLAPGTRVVLTADGAGEPGVVPVSYAGLAEAVRAGETILLDDGNLVFEVERVAGQRVECRVIAGGRLLSRKKVTLPRPPADLPPLVDDDLADLRLGAELGIDFVAASFVRAADDILSVRRVIEQFGGDQAIVAKFENASAVENMEAILEVADAVMVARGDLGVELPPEEVPVIQKRLIAACNRLGKPVITATQMLESMVVHARPTRAEASDVANAIFDGSDAVMLSAETAVGRYPIEAVRVMARIAERAERELDHDGWLRRTGPRQQPTITDAISFACCSTARALGAAAILTATQSGHTARMVSRYRPSAPIVAATPVEGVARKLSLVWGVTPVVVPATRITDEMISIAVEAAQAAGLIKPGALVVMTAGVPVGVPGTTNLVQVLTVGEVLVHGTGIGRQSRTATARVATHLDELRAFDDGDILVTPAINPEWMPWVERAGGLVVEEGGLTSQAAIAALHFGIPAVVGAEGATRRIADGAVITIDSRTGTVYRGRVTIR